jgi:carbonic anhydrase
MGHGFCGGCAAALTRQFDEARTGEGHFIAHWIDLLDEARDHVLAHHSGDLHRDAFQAMEMEGVKVSLKNLRTFPWVAEREVGGSLRLRGAFFAIADGILHLLDERSGTFAPA